MPAEIRVDSDAVRALAHFHAAHAAELSAVAAALQALPVADVAHALGPVGDRFAAALAAALTDAGVRAAALADGSDAGAVAAAGSASAYDDVQWRAAALIRG